MSFSGPSNNNLSNGLPSHLHGNESDSKAAYIALRDNAALIDRTHTGRIECTGADVLDLISRLSTNELMSIEIGQGAATVLTTPKGRIIDILMVSRSDDSVLLLTSWNSRQKILEHIDFFTFGENITARDVTDQTGSFAIAGPNAPDLMKSIAGVELERYANTTVSFGSIDASIVRTDFIGLPAYDLIVQADKMASLREKCLSLANEFGFVVAGENVVETVRVERGVPVYDAELRDSYNPLEANLINLVSFTKGCYVGQEVITRLDTYKKVKRSLVGLKWTTGALPVSGARLLVNNKQVGVMTSSACSPINREGFALGYLITGHTQPNTAVSMETDAGEIQARVVELPFTA